MASTRETYGFSLTRLKLFNGEALDISMPTFDGPNGIGSFILSHSYNWGRMVQIDEVYGELDIISKNTFDDKSQKREWRKQFLQLFSNSNILTDFFKIVTFYLNGHNLDIQNEKFGCIGSGGNIILIFGSLIHLSLYYPKEFLKIGENLLECDIEYLKLCIINFRLIFYLPNGVKRSNLDLLHQIIISDPSDLDFKIIPINNISQYPIPNTSFLDNYKTYLDNLIDINTQNVYLTIEIMDELQIKNQSILLSQDKTLIDYKIKTIALKIFNLINQNSHNIKKPHGRSCSKIFFQIAQEHHLEKFKNDKECYNYILSLLNLKEIVNLQTRMNTLIIINSINETYHNYLITLMATINYINKSLNYNLYYKIKNITLDNIDTFRSIESLKMSGLLQISSDILSDFSRHFIPSISQNIYNILEYYSQVYDNHKIKDYLKKNADHHF